MADNHKKNSSQGKASVQELVTVAFAEDLDLARQNKKLLDENGIYARIQEPAAGEGSGSIAVLVREEDLDQAHSLIASHASFEDFFDVFFRDTSRLLDEELDEDL